MKGTIAYYLMLLYVTVMVQPLVPIISNAWAHEFETINHLQTIHAKYGEHHVELAIAKTNNNSDKSKNTTKTKDTANEHLPLKPEKNAVTPQLVVTLHILKASMLPPVHSLLPTPPPKFIC